MKFRIIEAQCEIFPVRVLCETQTRPMEKR
jgi:hypothetical protein